MAYSLKDRMDEPMQKHSHVHLPGHIPAPNLGGKLPQCASSGGALLSVRVIDVGPYGRKCCGGRFASSFAKGPKGGERGRAHFLGRYSL